MIWKIFIYCTLSASILSGTQSSLFWTNCTTEVCPEGKGFFELSSYQKIVSRKRNGKSIPNDYGITCGVGSWKNISFEVGFDVLSGKNPRPYFNTKAGVGEDYFGEGSPSFSVGVSDVGIVTSGKRPTNQNIFTGIIGKNLNWKYLDTIYLGAFKGNRPMGKNRIGSLLGFEKKYMQETQDDRTWHRLKFSADIATGKNSIGGVGLGLTYFVTQSVSFQTGPIYFFSTQINGKWKWMFVLNVGLP
jgi:hypothetical protein